MASWKVIRGTAGATTSTASGWSPTSLPCTPDTAQASAERPTNPVIHHDRRRRPTWWRSCKRHRDISNSCKRHRDISDSSTAATTRLHLIYLDLSTKSTSHSLVFFTHNKSVNTLRQGHRRQPGQHPAPTTAKNGLRSFCTRLRFFECYTLWPFQDYSLKKKRLSFEHSFYANVLLLFALLCSSSTSHWL